MSRRSASGTRLQNEEGGGSESIHVRALKCHSIPTPTSFTGACSPVAIVEKETVSIIGRAL